MNQKDGVLALLIIVIWGMTFIATRWGLDHLPPLFLGALRFIFVAFPALFFIKRPALPLRWLMAYAMTISFGQFALLFSAMYLGMPAGLASLVLQAQVFFTICFANIFLGEAWRVHHVLALGIAASGLALLATQNGDTSMTSIGLVLTLAAALCWGAGNVINRRIGQTYPVSLLSLVVWSALVPPLPFLAASYLLEGPERIVSGVMESTLQTWGSVLYIALVATLFGYSQWGTLLKRYPAAHVAPLTLLIPVVGLIGAWVLLDETLNTVQGVGIALVLVGLLVSVFGGHRWLKNAIKTAAPGS